MTSPATSWRNPTMEAAAIVGPDRTARVLEPSAPAVSHGEWFADDPVAHEASAAAILPAGVAGEGDASWSQWLLENPSRAEWVTERWLGGHRELPAVPADLVPTRLALHRLGAYVIAPVRHQVNGKFGLRWTLGGFGTPFFGDDRQIRVADGHIVDQRGADISVAPITTLRAAAEFLGTTIDTETAAEHDSPPVGDIDEPLTVSKASGDFLGAWYGMAFAALEQVRADSTSVNPSRPQLWPGHFDPAIEVGDDDHRGSYGASPGDHSIDEPYLYVSLWWPDRLNLDPNDPLLNATAFTGAVLKLSDFGPGDSVDIAAGFFASIRDHTTR